MVSKPITQIREEIVLNDLRSHFPDFISPGVLWRVLPRGEDPPDAIGIVDDMKFGLELTEWLHEEQMTAAKGRENMRIDLGRILDWQKHPLPNNFRNAVVWPIWGTRIKRVDEESLCREFHQATKKTDENWEAESQWSPQVILTQPELQQYPILSKYVAMIQFHPGAAATLSEYGMSWIDFELDGGAYSADVAVHALCERINEKARDYETPNQQARIKAKRLSKLALLVHVGFNQYVYNTPYTAPWKNLKDVAREAAAYCCANPGPFDEIWLFHSLGTSHDLIRLF